MPKNEWGAVILAHDLEAAGIARTDATGRVADFHSLRHTFITGLARAGVHPKIAQDLARHFTIELTMRNYPHPRLESRLEALGKLPEIVPVVPETASAVKTGTDNADDSTPPRAGKTTGKTPDTPRDTFALDSDGKIWSYMESQDDRKTPVFATHRNEKSPVPQGQTGHLCKWHPGRESNPYLQLRRLSPYPLGYQGAGHTILGKCRALSMDKCLRYRPCSLK